VRLSLIIPPVRRLPGEAFGRITLGFLSYDAIHAMIPEFIFVDLKLWLKKILLKNMKE
jgi:hypothetical protein